MIDTSDLDRFARRLDTAARTIDDRTDDVTERSAEKIAEQMRRDVPRDTGQLAASIQTDGPVVDVGADYAPYVEYGTVSMAPQPFARPALRREKPDLLKGLEREAIDI